MGFCKAYHNNTNSKVVLTPKCCWWCFSQPELEKGPEGSTLADNGCDIKVALQDLCLMWDRWRTQEQGPHRRLQNCC